MTEKLTHWKKLTNPNYLGTYALSPGEEPILTIRSVALEMVTGADGKKEECTVMHFQEKGVKPMILNKTNCKTLEKMYGTPYIEEWAGHKVQLYPAMVNAFGSEVSALRIRTKEPKKVLPELTPAAPKWQGAVDSLVNGTNDIEGIKQYVRLSPENEKLMLDQVEAIKTQTGEHDRA